MSVAATVKVPIVPSIITSSLPSTTTSPTSVPSSANTLIFPSTRAITMFLILEFPVILMEFSPPPRIIVLPVTFTLSRTTSPSPTPSPMIKSPSTVTSLSVTFGTLIITFPLDSEVYVPASLIYTFTKLSIILANSALVIFCFGFRIPLDPFT